MPDDYLWDRSGPVDPELLKLESHLARYRKDAGVPPRRFGVWIPLAVAASIVGLLFWQFRPAPLSSWKLNDQPIAMHKMITTSAETMVQVGSIGRLRFEAGSKFRITRSEPGREEMDLLEGKFDALIIAAPHVFQVNTPPARLDDLGCAYEVRVNPDGNGRVAVTSGWVLVNAKQEESLVRQGYEVILLKGHPPSIPKRVSGDDADDPLTLLHRLWRSSTPEERVAAFDQLAKIHPPPAGVTRERASSGDRRIVRDYWPALQLGPSISLPRVFLD